jgi:transcriptional regulator with XRE-family HTH domain
MTYELEDIARSLKAARLAKGLSQRALSAKTGMTQAHISKIENASVDLQLSSLIELARALDLELTLVPAKAVPAVRGIVHLTEPNESMPRVGDVVRSLPRIGAAIEQWGPSRQRPAYSLNDADDD